MKKADQALLAAALLTACGLAAGGTSQALLEANTPKPFQPGQGEFYVAYLKEGAPKVAELNSLPSGASFYFEDSQSNDLSSKLKKQGAQIRLSQRSRSRKEHLVTLRLSTPKGLATFRYEAGQTRILPLSRATINSSTLRHAITRGLKWAALALLALPLLLFKRREA